MNSIVVETKGLNWEKDYFNKLVGLDEAAAVVKSGDRVGAGQASSAPAELLKALSKRKEELHDVDLYTGNLLYPFDFMRGEYKGHINYHAFFLQPFERKFMSEGNIDVSSVSLSNWDYWFAKVGRINVALLEVSPPDENGYMSFGPAGALMTPSLVDAASTIIVQVNKQAQFMNGMKETFVHVSDVDYICEADYPVFEMKFTPGSDIEKKMSEYIVEEIPNGACLQIGIGGVPNAICELLTIRNDLGIHSEMISDGVMKLYKNGNINNSRKNIDKGLCITGGAMATNECYNWMANTKEMVLGPSRYVNNPLIIAQNDNMMAINAALMVDLTGQIAAEAIGFKQFSGTGGQLDFATGASLSKGGKSFIALPSTVPDKATGGLVSRIVSSLPKGTPVSTPRSLAHFVVTEYGMVDLKNRSISERAKLLISIAHPEMRDQLTQEAKEYGLIR